MGGKFLSSRVQDYLRTAIKRKASNYFAPVAFMLMAIGIGSCSEPIPTYKYVGRIDSKLVELIDQAPKSFRLEINSGGGFVKDASQAAVIMADRQTSIIVRGRCLSACSEFILPAADAITFVDDPIVGFHWSPLMDRGQYASRLGSIKDCKFPAASIQEELFKLEGLNKRFWLEVEERLVLRKFRFVEVGNACPNKVRVFENKTWLPSSEQLKDLLGLEFTGSLCADDYNKCAKKVDRIWEKGDKIVIGDRGHIVGQTDGQWIQ